MNIKIFESVRFEILVKLDPRRRLFEKLIRSRISTPTPKKILFSDPRLRVRHLEPLQPGFESN